MRGVFAKMISGVLAVAWLSCQASFTAAITIEFDVDDVHWLAPNPFSEVGAPYVEQGIRFQDPLGGTSHVYEDGDFLALGDWGPDYLGGVSTSQVLVDHVHGTLLTLESLDYYFWDPGGEAQMTLESSKGGVCSLPMSGMDVSLVGDPDWQGISWFTVTGSGGTGIVEGSVDNVQISIPEPSNLALLNMGTLALLAYACRRRRW